MPGVGPVVFKDAQLPLRVYCSDPLLLGTTIDAVQAWNAWMGVNFLTVSGNSLEADIFIFGGESFRYNGVTQFYAVPIEQRGKYRYAHVAKIELYNGSTETLAHELGHAVGLAHDPGNERSIMHPYSLPRFLPGLEARDRRVLHRVYLK